MIHRTPGHLRVRCAMMWLSPEAALGNHSHGPDLVIGGGANPCWAYACYGQKVEKAVELRSDAAMPVAIRLDAAKVQDLIVESTPIRPPRRLWTGTTDFRRWATDEE